MEERAPGNSTQGYRLCFSALPVLIQKPAGRKTLSGKRPQHPSPFPSCHIQGCAAKLGSGVPVLLQQFCSAHSWVLLLGGLRFSSHCLDKPTGSCSSLGSQLSLTIDSKSLQGTEDKAWQTQNKLWRYSVTLYPSWSFSKHRGLHVQVVSTPGIQMKGKGRTNSF